MNTDARTFIDALFAQCSPSSFVTLTALPPNPDLPTPSRHIRLDDDAALSDALERLDAVNRLGWSGIVGVGTRSADIGRWRRGAKTDLAELPALFVDLDKPDGVTERIAKSPLLPSCMVASGHGIHLYFYLNEATRDWDEATRALQCLTVYFKGDPITSVAQSMRLPGTINCKSGRHSALCHIIDCHPERRYNLAEFAPFIQPNQTILHRPIPGPRPIIDAYDGDWNTAEIGDPNPALVRDVMRCLIADYGGRMKANGWLGAYCPCGHNRDRPGADFCFTPAWGMGVCFGRHGNFRLIDLCPLLGVDSFKYGWTIKKEPRIT